MPTFDTVVGSILERGCSDVFGTQCQAGLATDTVSYGHVAVIGFSGLLHRGHVGIAMPVGAARSLHPLGGDREEGLVSDYVGELVNMLLGRIKIQFERYGLDVHAGTPVVLRGVNLSIHACGDGHVTGCQVVTGGGIVQAWVDVLTPEEITFDVAETEPDGAVPEPGDTLLW